MIFPIVIATTPARAQQRKIALGASIILVAVVAITLPFANIHLTRVDAFVPVIQTVMCLIDLLTAVLLFAQFAVYPQRAMLALASGFVFSALFAFLQTLAFPGAYGPAALIGDELNSAGWLFVLWRTTFLLAVTVYALSKDTVDRTIRSGPSMSVIIGVTVACVATATAAMTWIATADVKYLPSLYENAIQQTSFANYINVFLSLFGLTTLILLFVRRNTILDHWLIVTLLAWLPNFIVAVLFTVVRFTVGWYMARIFALCAGPSLLFALLAETMMLYTRLAAAARIGAQQQRELTATVAALEQSKQSLERVNFWLDTALKNMAHGLSMFDKDQRLILCNERYNEIYGLARSQTYPGTTLYSILEARFALGNGPEKIDAHIDERLSGVRDSRASYAENELHDGRVVAVNYRPMPRGGWVAIHEEITERKRAEEQRGLLVAELDHRVKNVLARVTAVAKYTSQGSHSVDEFLRTLDGRIQSMADAHTLLSQSQWHGVNLVVLVQRQLAPYTTKTNTVISGPDITLTAVSTQALAMVLQELVTNAVKYGSLSTPHGKVLVNWDSRDGADGAPRLAFAWRETGGPSTKAPSHSSYGTNLIRNLIPREIGGTVDLMFAPEGLRCDIEISLTHRANLVRSSPES